jgi:hypothetical protein
MVAKPSLQEALEALKRDPTHPVRARVDDLTVELRAVTEPAAESAADAFREIGPWQGEETLEELLAFFAGARCQGASRSPVDL